MLPSRTVLYKGCWENLQWDKKLKMNISNVWSSILIVCSQCNRSSKAISLLLAAPLVSYRVSHNIAKCQFLDGCQVWPQLSHLFLNQFSKFLWLSCSKFRGLLKKGQKFLWTYTRTQENDENKVGPIIMGHPVAAADGVRVSAVCPSSGGGDFAN